MNEKIFIVLCMVLCSAFAYILEPGPVVIATKGKLLVGKMNTHIHENIHHQI